MAPRERPPGSLPRPGPLGRLLRLVLAAVAGVGALAGVEAVRSVPPGTRPPTLLLAGVALLAGWMLPHLTDMGFGRRWGNRVRVAAAVLAGVLAVVDLVAFGEWWAPPLAWYLVVLIVAVFGWFAVSLAVAGVAAVPG
ncbi:MAG: hypothetical protein KatS3mg011_1699 [Acidimicrobiia bacterium]|nr:MAG: hypothetical protein KatS3mg011_1699 [Acidimicrobiia bacterium]